MRSKFLRKYSLIPLFLLLAMASAWAQSKPGKEGYLLKARLVDADSATAVTLAHITNLTNGAVVVSTQDGSFVMAVVPGDSLLITRIGYVNQLYAVPAKALAEVQTIHIQPKTEELQEVVIFKFPSEAKLKEQILALELPDDKVKLRLPRPSVTPKSDAEGAQGVTLASVNGAISGVANKFNNKERGRQFKARIAVEEQRQAYIASKFNKNIVQQITGIKEEEQLNDFLKFCVLPEDFLYKANAYQIHDAVLGCFKEFIAIR